MVADPTVFRDLAWVFLAAVAGGDTVPRPDDRARVFGLREQLDAFAAAASGAA